MVRLTKAQRKQQEIINAWKDGMPYKMSSKDKFGSVPDLSIVDVLEKYIPEYEVDECGKFYTPLSIATELWGFLPHAPQYILEPCAGIGNLLYPIQEEYAEYPEADQPVSVTAYEFAIEEYEIGKRLFPWATWISDSPFDHLGEICGKYDTVLMNPPFGNSIRSVSIEYNENVAKFANGICKAAEHLFLMLAINALQPGGVAMVIAPYSFKDKLPKKLAPWVMDRVSEFSDMGEMDGKFNLTGIRVHGWLIERNSDFQMRYENEDGSSVVFTSIEKLEPPAPGGENQIVSAITSEPEIKDNETFNDTPESEPDSVEPKITTQTMLDLMPSEPPEPIEQGFIRVADIMDRLDKKSKDWKLKPTAEFIESVKQWGVYHPVICVTTSKDDLYTLSLKAGRRRIQAAITTGIDKIPYKVYSVSIGAVAINALALDTNTQSRPNPVYELEIIMELLEEAKARGIPQNLSNIKQITGMSVPTIKKRMRLQSLPASIIAGVKDGKVSKSVAEAIVNEPSSIRASLAQTLEEKGKLTGKDLAQAKLAKTTEAAKSLNWDGLTPIQPAEYVHLVIKIHPELELPGSIQIVLATFDKEKAIKTASEQTPPYISVMAKLDK